ncbi:MAG TPA: hypothetical protein DF383_09170 [Deltaproteobacteria bacterium]|nr:hypothetical protein [Deltaproteobacteria bacterium]
MKIKVPLIPEEGEHHEFDQETPWLKALLAEHFSDFREPTAPASGEIDIQKTLQNVAISGRLTLSLHPACARCGKAFVTELEVPLERDLAPYFSGPREQLLTEEEEVELSAEDLEFSFYHGEEIDLGAMLAEEIFLALPMRFLCRESCRGLCPSCGVNLNESSCSCRAADISPFAVLKDLRVKS